MLARLASISAFLLWCPGVAVTVYGDRMLSPYELLIALMLPVVIVTSFQPRRLLFGVVSLAICTASYLHSLDRSTSGIYWLYYVFIIIPHMLFFLQIFEDDCATRAFLSSFVRSGVWLAPLAAIQFLSPVPISFINNTNYSLQFGIHRAQLFAPEASILAALYVVALCLAIYNAYLKIEPRIPSNTGAFVLLTIGLASTVSTSAFIVLPPLLMMTFSFCGVPLRSLIRYMALGVALLVAFYFLEYQDRVSSGDTTGSTLIRLASMAAGIQIIFQHSMTGLGLGMNKTVADAIAVIYASWAHELINKPGIDSFQISLMAEMGISPGFLSALMVVVCYRCLAAHRIVIGQINRPLSAVALVALLSICVWVISLLTSGYRGLAYCWLFFPAGYMVHLKTGLLNRPPMEEATLTYES